MYIKFLQTNLQEAQNVYKIFANHLRNESLAFHVGDKVWFFWQNMKNNRPCKKIDYRWLGPFYIKEQINLVVYLLELPTLM